MNAMNNDAVEAEREDIEELLPWYVTGRLASTDKAKIESYLARHPDLSGHLALIRSERDATVRANEAVGPPSTAMLRRLLASLPSNSARNPTAPWLRGILDLFRSNARAAQWAAMALGLLILAQAATIAVLIVHDRTRTYQVASGAPQSEGVVALIGFSDTATAPAMARLLADFDANIVDGPKPGGVYKIRIRTLERSQSAQHALLAKLAERRDLVRFVVPSSD
jgi:anti-sigma factor RsiW